jgi:hypothetical protein
MLSVDHCLESGDEHATCPHTVPGCALAGCAHRTPISTDELPLRRVVVYRNGVGYFERGGMVKGAHLPFFAAAAALLASEAQLFLRTGQRRNWQLIPSGMLRMA